MASQYLNLSSIVDLFPCLAIQKQTASPNKGKKSIQITFENEQSSKATNKSIEALETKEVRNSPVIYNPDPCLNNLRNKVVKFLDDCKTSDERTLRIRPLTSKTKNSRNKVVKAGQQLLNTLDVLTKVEQSNFTTNDQQLQSNFIEDDVQLKAQINILSEPETDFHAFKFVKQSKLYIFTLAL